MTAAMIDAALDLLRCPVCTECLQRADRALQCPNRHSFDIARQGYVNLLRGPAPANADTTQMVAARQRFLASGAYQPIVDAVLQASAGTERVAEVGAGTGHYLAQVVQTHRPSAHLGLDVSVAAARRSARAGLASVVADTWAGLPVATGALDGVLCIFAPRNPAEFARVLGPDGKAIVVTPTADHLSALRTELGLLDIPDDKQDRLNTTMAAAGLTELERIQVRYRVSLNPDQVSDLVAMGPNAFHSQAPEFIAPVAVDVHVVVSQFASGA